MAVSSLSSASPDASVAFRSAHVRIGRESYRIRIPSHTEWRGPDEGKSMPVGTLLRSGRWRRVHTKRTQVRGSAAPRPNRPAQATIRPSPANPTPAVRLAVQCPVSRSMLLPWMPRRPADDRTVARSTVARSEKRILVAALQTRRQGGHTVGRPLSLPT